MTAGIEAVWPLFGLRVRTERLVLRLPREADLLSLIALAKEGIHPAGEMPFGVAWSTVPSPAFERGFVQHHWGLWAHWAPDAWGLNLMVELEGRPIGAQSIHAREFAVFRTVDTGVLAGSGLPAPGSRDRDAGRGPRVCLRRARRSGRRELVLPRQHGLAQRLPEAWLAENGRGSLAPEGVARETQRFRRTAEAWRSRPRPPVTIEGLDASRELYGL